MTAKVSIACPGSCPEVRPAGQGFAARGRLASYYTTLEPASNALLRALRGVPGSPGRHARRESRRRDLGAAAEAAQQCAFSWDLLAVVVTRLSAKSRWHLRAAWRRDRAFDAAVSRRLEVDGGADVFLGQAGSCRLSLGVALAQGMQTAVNWNIQHWRTAQAEYATEAASNPQWARLFTHGRFPQRLIDEWERELDLTNLIITPSGSVADSFVNEGFPRDRVRVVPYGVDAERFRPAGDTARGRQRLRVCCLGELGQRKGLSYFFDIARLLPDIEFTAAGWRVAPLPEEPPPNLLVQENVPDVVPYLQAADVFLFPSLLDGFGLVVLQAMACGLPAICSLKAGACDVITEGVDGWMVDPRDVAGAAAILRGLDADRALLATMAGAARKKALDHPWERFQEELDGALWSEGSGSYGLLPRVH